MRIGSSLVSVYESLYVNANRTFESIKYTVIDWIQDNKKLLLIHSENGSVNNSGVPIICLFKQLF